MGEDADRVGEQAEDGAEGSSSGKCLKYVRMAVQRAFGESTAVGCGIENAKDSAPWFESKGFRNVNTTSFNNGDVVIMAGVAAHPIGHVQVYNSGKWYSDFRQNGFYPYKDGSKPAYSVYRL